MWLFCFPTLRLYCLRSALRLHRCNTCFLLLYSSLFSKLTWLRSWLLWNFRSLLFAYYLQFWAWVLIWFHRRVNRSLPVVCSCFSRWSTPRIILWNKLDIPWLRLYGWNFRLGLLFILTLILRLRAFLS